MNAIGVVFIKEIRVLLASPLLYVFWAATALVVGVLFYLGLSVSPEPNLRVLTINLGVVNVVLLPLIAMGMFAEEEKQGTLEMLLTVPGSLWRIVMGKYLAGMLLGSGMLICSILCSIVLAWLGTPDWGAIVIALCGQALCLSFCLAVSLFASSLTREPLASGLLAIVFLFPFWIGGRILEGVGISWIQTLVQDLSLMEHLIPMSKGIFDMTDLLWFVLGTGWFLWLTVQLLEGKRCR